MTHKESLMVFFDGTAKQNEKSGIGYVVQTVSGQVMDEAYGWIETEDSMLAEAVAVREAVRHVRQKYPQTEVLYIKGDNKGVIESVSLDSHITVSGDCRSILKETRQELQDFELVSSSLVKNRSLNEKAHKLAYNGRVRDDADKIQV